MGKLGYRPALDGVRAISIALVLVFHLGAPWLEGGYLGVSVFFTLSGFLITSLLLGEKEGAGRIDIGAFYVRRLRRLLPASLLVLIGIAALAAAGAIAARGDLRSGLLGAVFQVANWERLLGEQSYADLFLSPSPVDHFWSLAIEEQFYWVWPLVVAGITRVAPGRVFRVLTGAFVAFSVAAFVTAQRLGGDVAYFASWARFAEILCGAALAAAVFGRTLPAWTSKLAAPSLTAIVTLSVVTPAGRGWAYAGGLPAFSLLSAALVLGVHRGDGAVARLLAREPIPWIGRISYGLYLFHWPVFTILDGGVVAKLAVTVGLTVASYHLLERPIRTGRWITSARAFVPGAAVGFVTAAALVAVLVPTPSAPRRTSEPVVIAAAPANAVEAPPTSTIVAEDAPDVAADQPAATVAAPVVTAPPSPRVIALFGDSIADWLLRDAAPTFRRADVTLVDAAVEGCDAAVDIPDARGRAGQLLPLPDDCREWTDAYPAVVENTALPVDVAVLVVGNAPIVDRRVGGRWVGPCEDMQWYVADLEARIGYLAGRVGDVVLALPSWGGVKASFLSTDDHLERSACIRDALRALAARVGIATVDLAELLCPAGPDGACTDLRDADGTHVDPDDAPAVLDWLLSRV